MTEILTPPSALTATRQDSAELGKRSRTRADRRRAYTRRLLVSDAVVLSAAVLVALATKFGFESRVRTNGGLQISYPVLGVGLVLAWIVALGVIGSRDRRMVRDGAVESRRVVSATVYLFGSLSIASVLLKVDVSRGYLAVAFPLGLVLLLLSRKLWRVRLRQRRAAGEMTTRALLVGGRCSAAKTIDLLHRDRGCGIRTVGVWAPRGDAAAGHLVDMRGDSIPVLGADQTLAEALAATEPDVVIVADSEHLGHDGLKELTWALGASDVDLVVSPNVVDVSTSRLHLTTVASMPFLHVAEPQYEASLALPKTIFDRLGATALLALIWPVMVLTALAVKLTSRGPVFYRQERVGRDGTPFQMIKFRSMRQNADAELMALLESEGQDDQPLYKLQQDPRITTVGGFIRRFSIDELPQLLNVLKGDMSLVGPRPQRDFEVETYDDVAQRRLRVLPGVTGLWQVSGRSDLTWEDALRLDTYYVENWSLTGDLIILWKTIRAVIASDGAY